MGPGWTVCHRSSTSALVLNLCDIYHYQLKGSCLSVPACHHVEVSNHGLAVIIIIITIISIIIIITIITIIMIITIITIIIIIIIVSYRIVSLLSPVGMCQYKGKVGEHPTSVALHRPLIFGVLPDLQLILSSCTHCIQHTSFCTFEL